MAKQKIIAKLHSKFIYMRKGDDTFISYRFIPVDPYDMELISLIKYNIDPGEEIHKLITVMEYSIEYDESPEISHGTQIVVPCTVDYSDSLSPDKPIDNLYLIIKW
jgi:hypothetical protein